MAIHIHKFKNKTKPKKFYTWVIKCLFLKKKKKKKKELRLSDD